MNCVQIVSLTLETQLKKLSGNLSQPSYYQRLWIKSNVGWERREFRISDFTFHIQKTYQHTLHCYATTRINHNIRMNTMKNQDKSKFNDHLSERTIQMAATLSWSVTKSFFGLSIWFVSSFLMLWKLRNFIRGLNNW